MATTPVPDDRACAAVVGTYLGKPVICGVPFTVHMFQTYTHPFVPARRQEHEVVARISEVGRRERAFAERGNVVEGSGEEIAPRQFPAASICSRCHPTQPSDPKCHICGSENDSSGTP
jgi:hypothetical protein